MPRGLSDILQRELYRDHVLVVVFALLPTV